MSIDLQSRSIISNANSSLSTVRSLHDQFVAHLKVNGNPPDFPAHVVVDARNRPSVQWLGFTGTAEVRYVLAENNAAWAEYVFLVPDGDKAEDAVEVGRFYLNQNGQIKTGIESNAAQLMEFKSDQAASVIVGKVLTGMIESRLFKPRPLPATTL